MSTYFPKEGEIARKWFVVDATGQTLGRLASRVAHILMGKESPNTRPLSIPEITWSLSMPIRSRSPA